MKKYFALILSVICLYFISKLSLQGSGFFDEPSIITIIAFSIIIIALNASKKLFYFILLPIILIHALYTPIGLSFSSPTYSYIASVFATTFSESKEFLQQIPISRYLTAIVQILLLFVFRYITQQFHIYLHKNKTLVAFGLLTLALSVSPLKLISEGYTETMKVKKELERLNNFQIPSQWGQSTLENTKYDDYVLIIGESARRDYLNAYGYPVNDTPFMNSVNGTVVNGLTSGGTNTIASLRLMLTQPNTQTWEPHYELTLIDLIKSAGIKTYWLSMQGQLGEFDTPISSIASKSDMTYFFKKGSSFDENISDFKLIPKFDEVLQTPTETKRFIVLHLYGSHPLACDRVEDYPLIYEQEKLDKKYRYINCYISSIKKTDELLKQVYETLQKNAEKNHRTFSMIYFSDHGVAHSDTNGEMFLGNNYASKFHHNIPLLKISSDDTEHKTLTSFKSGLNFTNAIANWIGIRNPKVDNSFDLFNGIDDPSDYGLKEKIQKYKHPTDPAIDISKP
ncbi:glucan phosphoethanolaminetransferase (alkaline phosphatase superfamily) [Bisgaardia hudsonensis]|uniref:Glucan phosphoethanolaminetransferase (Alkaline phosphatase superfamily) n=1 Tax=Bisgaardia hudsonensis TaxID=109472 RepID=A0A4V6NQ96_9PAST|nr:phosphoethanolamine transferase [Bisgaardia hudsonensis]TCP14290.1 glucan phosphoethanolaminetransferase (alkaline phosphatase superfamily) [Bisgaardia hudsonensis]